MKQEDKDLLLRDLCARLPYGVRIKRETITGSYAGIEFTLSLETFNHLKIGIQEDRYSIRPYLRPMSSMTEEEKLEMHDILSPKGTAVYGNEGISMPVSHFGEFVPYEFMFRILHFLYKRHFDVFDLISKGLALEAKEGMYNNTKTE